MVTIKVEKHEYIWYSFSPDYYIVYDIDGFKGAIKIYEHESAHPDRRYIIMHKDGCTMEAPNIKTFYENKGDIAKYEVDFLKTLWK